MIFKQLKQGISDVYVVGNKINEINKLKLDATNITGYATALKGLTIKQAELVLSTKGLTVAQQQAILAEAGLLKTTGRLTTAELTAILVNKKRNKDQAEALLIKTGLITAEKSEATATNVITAEKLKELVQTKALTQAEADLIAAKAGVALASKKESASLLAGVGSGIKGLGSGLKSAGAGVLALAKAHPAIAAITAVIGVATVAVGIYKKKQEEAAKAIKEAYENAKTTIDDLNNTFEKNSSEIKEIAKEYAELAQGVNQLTGENKSLNNEDYEKFLNLSNQIAEIFPALPRIYRENGKAIVELSGDVDTIVGSLQNLIEVQRDLTNKQIADELPSIFKGVVAKSNEYKEQLSSLESRRDVLEKSLEIVKNEELYSDLVNGLSNRFVEFFIDDQEAYYQIKNDYIKILRESGLYFEELSSNYEVKDGVEVPVSFAFKILPSSTDEDIEKAKDTIDGKIKELASKYQTDVNGLNEKINSTNEKNKANWSSLSSSIFAWLSTDDMFKVMDDTTQATVQRIINNLDWEKLDFSSWEEAQKWIHDEILYYLHNTTDGKETLADIEVMFGIQTQFNDGTIPVGQYQQKLQEFLNSIETLPPEVKKAVLLLFGIQTNDDGTTTSDVDTMVENVKKKLKGTEFDDRVEELNLGDLKIAANLEVDDDTIQSYDELLERIKKEKGKMKISFSDIFSLKDAENKLTPLGKINEEIDKFQSAYKGLKEAMDSYNETGTFTLDQVQEIISYGGDYLKYLMDENGNLQLNEEALNKVAIARINEMRAKALSNLMDKLDTITNEEQALSYLETQLLNTATAYDDLTASRIKAWSENALENGISQETINKVTKSFENQVSAINEMFNSISIDSIYKSPSSSATKDAEQATKDYIDSYMNYMEQSLETGRIDYQTYSRDVAKFLKDMYDQGKIAAKDYHDYTKQMLEVQKEVKLCLAS